MSQWSIVFETGGSNTIILLASQLLAAYNRVQLLYFNYIFLFVARKKGRIKGRFSIFPKYLSFRSGSYKKLQDLTIDIYN